MAGEHAALGRGESPRAPAMRRPPAPPTPLIGRDADLAAARERLLGGVRLLTLTGPADVGKTHLALALAASVRDQFPQGVAFVDLAPVRDPALLGAAIAGALGDHEAGGEAPFDRVRRLLAEGRALLVLDNFEQLLAAAPQVAELLGACPEVVALVTSRAPLHLRGEQEFPVPALRLPPRERGDGRRAKAGAAEAEGLLEYAAIRLFVERARAVRPGFALTAESAPAVAAVCADLDGLPLAIELAAARSKTLSPEAILARLGRRLDLLAGGPVDLPVRQQTLRAAIGWSHDLLGPEEQLAFRRLGVFVGGVDAEAAEAVIEGGCEVRILDLLASLADKSLLRVDEGPAGEPRFSMLDTIREYALEQLLTRGELDTARRRHADSMLTLAQRAEPGLVGAEQAAWIERLEREHDNLRAALAWATAVDGAAETALRLAGALSRFWEVRGHVSEGRAYLDRALALADHAPAADRVKAWNAAGNLARAQGDLDGAAAAYAEALALLRDLGDQRRMAILLNNLGVVAQDQGRYERAAALYGESLALKRALGDGRGAAMSLNNLGMVARYRGRPDEAVPLFEESLALLESLDDEGAVALVLSNLGAAALDRGDRAVAETHARRGLRLRARLGDRPGIAWSLAVLAAVAAARAAPARAARLLGAAAALREAAGVRLDPAARAEHDRTEADLRARLGERAFMVEWSSGRTRPLDEAIAEALVADDAGEDAHMPPGPTDSSSLIADNSSLPGGLTAREAEVLALLAAGQTNKEIAAALVLSVRTVENHRASIYAKIGARGRADVVAYARRYGLVAASP